MPEVVTRAGFDTKPTTPEVDLVEIRLEDLLLRVVTLHLARRGLLVELARNARSPADLPPVDDVRMHVSHELLRDRARAAPVLAKNLAFDCAEYADDVDAVMLVEALVFDGDERLRYERGQRLE